MEDDYEYDSDSDNDSIGDRFISDRRANDQRLKSRFEHIFRKYERDFTGIGDEIDLYTGHIVVNNGHLQSMQHEVDPGQVAASTFIDSLAHDYNPPTTEATPELQEDDDDSAFHRSLHNLGNEIDRLGSATPNESSEDDTDARGHGTLAHSNQHAGGGQAKSHPGLARVRQAHGIPNVDTDSESENNSIPSHIRVLQSMPGVFKDSLLAMQNEAGPFDKASLDQLEHNIAAQVAQFLATSNPAMYDGYRPAGVRESAWAYPELPPRKKQRLDEPSAARPSLSSSAALFTKSPRQRGSLWAPAQDDRGWGDVDLQSEIGDVDDTSANGLTDAQARFMSVVQDHDTPQLGPSMSGTSLYTANTARRILPKQPGQDYVEGRPIPPRVFDFIQFIPKQLRRHVQTAPPEPRAGAMLQWKDALHMQSDLPPTLAPKVLPAKELEKAPKIKQIASGPASNNEHLLALQKKHVRKLTSRRFLEGNNDDLKQTRFTEEEDMQLVELRHRRKLEWHEIEEHMPGRSSESIYNRYCYIRRTIMPDILELPTQYVITHGPHPRPPPPELDWGALKNPKRAELLRRLFAGSGQNSPHHTAPRPQQVPVPHPISIPVNRDQNIPNGASHDDTQVVTAADDPPATDGNLPDHLVLPYDFTEDDDRAIKLMRERRGQLFDDIAMHFPGTTAHSIGYRYYNFILGRKYPTQSKESKTNVEKILARATARGQVRQPPQTAKSQPTAPKTPGPPEIVSANPVVSDNGVAPSIQPHQPHEETYARSEVPNSTASQHEWTEQDRPVHGPWIWPTAPSNQDKTSSKHDSVLDDAQDTSANLEEEHIIFDQAFDDSLLTVPEDTSTPQQQPLPRSSPPIPRTEWISPQLNNVPSRPPRHMQPETPGTLINTNERYLMPAPPPTAHPGQGQQGMYTTYTNTPQPLLPRPTFPAQHTMQYNQNMYHTQSATPQGRPLQARPLRPTPGSHLTRQFNDIGQASTPRSVLPTEFPAFQTDSIKQSSTLSRKKDPSRSQYRASGYYPREEDPDHPRVPKPKKQPGPDGKPPRKRKSVVHSAGESDSGSEFDPGNSDDDRASDAETSPGLFGDAIDGYADDSSASDDEAVSRANYKIVLEPPARDRFLEIAAQMVKPREVQVPRARPNLICHGSEDEDHSDYGAEVHTDVESADEIDKERLRRSGNNPLVAEAFMQLQAGNELRNLGSRMPKFVKVPDELVHDIEALPIAMNHIGPIAVESALPCLPSIEVPLVKQSIEFCPPSVEELSKGANISYRANVEASHMREPIISRPLSIDISSKEREPSHQPTEMSTRREQITSRLSIVEESNERSAISCRMSFATSSKEPTVSSQPSVATSSKETIVTDQPSAATSNDEPIIINRSSTESLTRREPIVSRLPSTELSTRKEAIVTRLPSAESSIREEPIISYLPSIELSTQRKASASTMADLPGVVDVIHSTATKRRKVGPWEEDEDEEYEKRHEASVTSNDADKAATTRFIAPTTAVHQERVDKSETHQSPAALTSTPSTSSRPRLKLTVRKPDIDQQRRASSTSLAPRKTTPSGHRPVTKAGIKKRQSAPSRMNEVQRVTYDLSEDELA